MESINDPQWILSLSFRLVMIIHLLLHLGNTIMVLGNDPNNPGYISIDCGTDNDFSDNETGISYQTDKNFVQTGTNKILPRDQQATDFGGVLNTLRSFPDGKRNCYTLKPNQGKNHTYLIRAYFYYGNYDYKNQTPTFDLYIGVNHWETVNPKLGHYHISECIYTPTTDTIYVCFVKGDIGIPYISALELRPLSNSVYQTSSPLQSLLALQVRVDVASTDNSASFKRYKDDMYDRLWKNDKMEGKEWKHFNRSLSITNDSYYKLPPQVLSSAAKSSSLFSALNYDHNSISEELEKSSKYYVYFHFLEIEQLGRGHKRIINITLNDENILSQPLTLEYMIPLTISYQDVTQGNVRFSISATSESSAPPILNAFEIYKLIAPLSSPTQKTDVDAILDIQNTYKISRLDWQGDPCLPSVAWEGLKCLTADINNSNARITSLNLSSSKLTGPISTSFSLLTELESLDLSHNHLSESVPEFLANLPKLNVLNLTGNKLEGSIPKALKKKSKDGTLELRLGDNPGLCLKDTCSKNFVIPLVASFSALIIIILVSLGIWIFRTRKLKALFGITDSTTREPSVELKNLAFSYTKVLKITDNLKNMIGEGGFGKVYLGTLKNDTKVAVKLLSQSSNQGHREFQSELELLMVVHHRYLVSLIGYCEEGGVKALIYEYMAHGNLRQHLSVENPNVLKWKKRLQIALDAASGLEYLHNGCKPPIVHRDLKTSNILLNENMEAKISDFGLSRTFANDNDTHISTRLAGTIGYLDPEFQTSGNMTKRSDVYSFGIILLELITGQPAITRETAGNILHIIHLVTPKFESGDIQSIFDPRLQGNYSADSALKFVEIAMSCTALSAVERPDISQIVVDLKECLAMENTSISRHCSYQFDSDSILSPR